MTNPALEALRRNVSGKISPNNPPITGKPTLASMRAEIDALDSAFEAECLKHWRNGKWGAYQAWEKDLPVPEAVATLHDAYIAALHAFYGARDGESGFLGSRGL